MQKYKCPTFQKIGKTPPAPLVNIFGAPDDYDNKPEWFERPIIQHLSGYTFLNWLTNKVMSRIPNMIQKL